MAESAGEQTVLQRRVLALLWVAFFVAYLDRANIALAGPSLVHAFGLTKTQFGGVLAAFTAGYALLQIPGGLLADRFGAKRMLIVALAVWSTFTGLTGLAFSLAALIVVRVLFGVGEGLENGAHFKALGDTFPERERSGASALFHTALALGPAVAAPISSAIIVASGWRALFWWFVLPGAVVVVLLARFFPAGTGRIAGTTPVWDYTTLARAPASWLAFAAYGFFNVAFWGFNGWFPTYLNQTRHIDIKALGAVALVPYLFGLLGLLAIGWLGHRPCARARTPLTAAAYVAAGIGFLLAFRAANAAASVAGLSVAAFFLYGSFGPFWAVALGATSDAVRGTFSGFVNFGGQIGGFCAPIAVGAIVDRTGSFTLGFEVMAAALVIAAACEIALGRAITSAETAATSANLPA